MDGSTKKRKRISGAPPRFVENEANKRVVENPKLVQIDGDCLVCCPCNKQVSTKKSVLRNHFLSAEHIEVIC